MPNKEFVLEYSILVLHGNHHETHTDTKKNMQMAATFRGVAIINLKRVSLLCFFLFCKLWISPQKALLDQSGNCFAFNSHDTHIK